MREDREAGNFCVVGNVTKFGMSGSMDQLGMWKRWQDPLACNKRIFGTSC
jgi:hypothetical protein